MSNYFDGLKVGDKLWSLMHGEVKVFSIVENSFPITCKTLNGDLVTFTFDGRWSSYQLQTLFWSKPEFEIPSKQTKPKEKKLVPHWPVVFEYGEERGCGVSDRVFKSLIDTVGLFQNGKIIRLATEYPPIMLEVEE